MELSPRNILSKYIDLSFTLIILVFCFQIKGHFWWRNRTRIKIPTWYSLLNPEFSQSDMFAICALMFLTEMYLFIGGPFFVFSCKIRQDSFASVVWSWCHLFSEFKKKQTYFHFYLIKYDDNKKLVNYERKIALFYYLLSLNVMFFKCVFLPVLQVDPFNCSISKRCLVSRLMLSRLFIFVVFLLTL